MNNQALIVKHNPILIMLPENTKLKRPGAIKRGCGRGDYHPCSAELFLSLVIWRAKPKRWLVIPLLRLLSMFKETPIGLKALEQKTLAANPDSIVDWEIDLASITSQDSSHAWREYRKIRDDPPPEGDLEPAVYARLVQGRNGLVLQYWYLYIYNDAPNKHEGDWEMVSIQLNEQQQPVRAGYAGHAGGFRLEWDDVTRDGGDRPLVFVVRGSHAAYFDHNPNGH